MLAPPSTGRTTPVTNLAAGEQRYTAAWPTSRDSPTRPIGVRDRIFSNRAGSPANAWRFSAVSNQPGAMALIRTPCGENSVASNRVRPATADFAAHEMRPRMPKGTSSNNHHDRAVFGDHPPCALRVRAKAPKGAYAGRRRTQRPWCDGRLLEVIARVVDQDATGRNVRPPRSKAGIEAGRDVVRQVLRAASVARTRHGGRSRRPDHTRAGLNHGGKYRTCRSSRSPAPVVRPTKRVSACQWAPMIS
jgi:hypothetical protein